MPLPKHMLPSSSTGHALVLQSTPIQPAKQLHVRVPLSAISHEPCTQPNGQVGFMQSTPPHPFSQRQPKSVSVTLAHLPWPEQMRSVTLEGHALRPQSALTQPGRHTQVGSSSKFLWSSTAHSPWPLQCAVPLQTRQSGSRKPGSQWQRRPVPSSSQRPRPHSLGHVVTLQSSPVQPFSHAHSPALHDPWPLHWLGQSRMAHPLPIQPSSHSQR
mmetsp:Transcript_29706/g.97168  ORF Transcript_29706/g.97168 Transcript_29706/m.97168 type:complete len:214 (-) Transcript_29706:363-1004(-)